MRIYATIFVLAMLLGCGGGGGQGNAPALVPVAKTPTPTPPPAPPCTSCQVPPAPCPPIKVGPIWASDPVTGAAITPTSVAADGTPHYTFTAGQQVQFHAPVTGGC